MLAQATPSSDSSASHPITLDVVVTGKDGNPITGLEKQDFTLLDGKQTENITAFQAVPAAAGTPIPPVQAIFVIDTVNTSYQTLSTARQQLEKFFRQNGGHLPLPVSLSIFSNTGLNTQPTPSTDGNVELQFLDQNQFAVHTDNRAQSDAGAFDRIERSLSALRTLAISNVNVPGRKLLIWVSPGWPIPMESSLGLSQKETDQIFNRIVVASGLLMISRITLYSVDPLGTEDAGGLNASRYRDYLGEIKNAAQSHVGNLALQVFAVHSGGRVFTGSNDLVGELNSCVDDANSYYMLSFDPPHADRPNEYHHIEVKVDKPNAKVVRTRTGYYIQP
jgi:VWFA-related protein